MAKKAYIGVAGVARKVKGGYIGVPKNLLSEPSAMTLSGASVSNGVISFPVNGSIALIQQSVAVPVAGHKYYARLAYNAPSGLSSTVINVQMWANDYAGGYITFYSATSLPTQDGQWRTLSAVREAPSSPASGSWVFRSYVYAGNVACQMKELFLIDLTAIFGVGNEPSKEWCDANVGYSIGNGESVSVARKIKKAYIGIGGVARPCWSGGGVEYWGTATAFSVSRRLYAATTIGNYALFGGGFVSSPSNVVNAYDETLTRTLPTGLGTTASGLAATTVGDYALFGGGYSGGSLSTVTAYNTSLTRKIPASLQQARDALAAASNGAYALFAGGAGDEEGYVYSCVDAYNASLTRSTPSYGLYYELSHVAATRLGGYALFGGGSTPLSDKGNNTISGFDTSLTNRPVITLGYSAWSIAATTVGDYALFGGGYGSEVNAKVSVINTSITRISLLELSVARSALAATTIGNYAIFGGGSTTSPDYGINSNVVDIFDTSLTRTLGNPLSAARSQLGAATVGNYALFGGGHGSGTTVDVYTVA